MGENTLWSNHTLLYEKFIFNAPMGRSLSHGLFQPNTFNNLLIKMYDIEMDTGK